MNSKEILLVMNESKKEKVSKQNYETFKEKK